MTRLSALPVLLADNDADFLATRKEYLEREGYSVVPAQTTADAVRILDEGNISLAILDIRLVSDEDEKDLSGLMLAKATDYRGIPKIILTGFPSASVVRDALRLDADGWAAAAEFLDKKEGACSHAASC